MLWKFQKRRREEGRVLFERIGFGFFSVIKRDFTRKKEKNLLCRKMKMDVARLDSTMICERWNLELHLTN